MNRTQFELLMDEGEIAIEKRDFIWESVLGRVSSIKQECPECNKEFYPHRSDQVYCPGGDCNNKVRQRRYRDKHIS